MPEKDSLILEAEEGSGANPNDEVADEYAIEQRIVPFMGDELAAALTQGGSIYITLPAMCGALGLSVRGQTQRIQRTRSLGSALAASLLRLAAEFSASTVCASIK